MKILLLHQYFLGDNEPGGSRFNQFAKYWREQGHEITVIAGNVNYTTGQKEEKYKGKWISKERLINGVDVYRTYVSESYNKSFVGRLWAYFSFTFSSLAACLFLVKKHDVMIVTSPPLFVGITGILTRILRRIPMVFEVRDLWPESAIDTGVLKSKALINCAYLVEKWSYRFASKINVLTPAFREKLISEKSVPKEKIVFIPNGADLDIFQPGERNNWVRETYKLQDKFLITYLGAHGVANNLISILKVAEHCKDIPEIMFMLVGDGMEKASLQQYAQEREIINVIFVPSQSKSKVPDFCRASDVCTAVLKKVDTFKTVYPNKVFDYMSCAKPIIIGIDGVARDLIEESNSGFYVDPESPQQFKEKILQLMNDGVLAAEMGASGYQYVQSKFSRESLALNYLQTLEVLADSKRQQIAQDALKM